MREKIVEKMGMFYNKETGTKFSKRREIEFEIQHMDKFSDDI